MGAPPIVLFGGTFDPLHVGHLIVAQDVVEALGADELRFVVAARPPHKGSHPGAEGDEVTAPAEARARMVEAAVAGDPRFRVSRIELEREGASWTVETLRTLHAAEPGVRWRLVIGVDQLETLDTWREPAEVARLASLVVMGRDGREATAARAPVDVSYETVEVTRVDVSSTLVRRRLREGRSIRYLVPGAVRRIIEDEGLYAARVPRGDDPR